MAYQQRDNTGSLWINDRKTEEKHPDRTGTIIVAGVEYFLDGWLKETPAGKKFLSLSVKRKNKQATPPEGQESRPSPQRPLISKPRPPGSPPPPRDPEYGDLDAPNADPNF